MQQQDFERAGELYHSYDMQKLHPQSHRTLRQRFAQDFFKMLGILTAFIPPLAFYTTIKFMEKMKESSSATFVTAFLALFLCLFVLFSLVAFVYALMTSTSSRQKRKKVQFPQAERGYTQPGGEPHWLREHTTFSSVESSTPSVFRRGTNTL